MGVILLSVEVESERSPKEDDDAIENERQGSAGKGSEEKKPKGMEISPARKPHITTGTATDHHEISLLTSLSFEDSDSDK